jgi:hypothetical protein
VGHVERIGGGQAYTGFWWENLRERDNLGNTGVDEMIILKWIFSKENVGVWTGSSLLRLRTGDWHL